MSGKLLGLGLAAALLCAAAVPAGATQITQSGQAADALQIGGGAGTENGQEYEVEFGSTVLSRSNSAKFGLPIVSVNLATASKYVLNPYRMPVTLDGQQVRDTIVCQPVVIRSFSNVPLEVTATISAEVPKGSRVTLADTPGEASEPGLGLFAWAEFANGTILEEAKPGGEELPDAPPDPEETAEALAVETAPEGVTVAEMPDGLDGTESVSEPTDDVPEAEAPPEEESVRRTEDGTVRRTIPASAVQWYGTYRGYGNQAVRGVSKHVLTIPAADGEPSIAYARFFGVAGIPSDGAWSGADTADLSITLSFKAQDGTEVTSIEDYLAPRYDSTPWDSRSDVN